MTAWLLSSAWIPVNSATPDDFGNGIVLTATFQLAINSTNADVTSIGGVPLNDSLGDPIKITADTYSVVGSGTLALGVGGFGFLIKGSIFASLDTQSGETTIAVSGVLTATAANATLLTMNAQGVLLVYANKAGGRPAI